MLTYDSTGFRLDGRPLRILSGAMHYFRTRPEQWPARLAALRAMGLNTVETYVPWNLHEPSPGRFERLDELGAFLDEAHRQGLWTIVRPGPYICAEWDNGGLPGWLTAKVGRRARTSDPEYLAAVDAFFDVLLPQVVDRQWGRPGGTVLMVQVENEYGSFGSDRVYLDHLARGLRERGVTVPLFTSDGPEDHMLGGGTVPGILATVNFGSDPETAFETLRRHRPQDPPFCMEFWNGWFDHWAKPHHTRDTADAADSLRRILAAGGSVNLYMAHGGTNFGTTAGANHEDAPFNSTDWTHSPYQPTTTSYDYDAALDERGLPSAKFDAFRQVIADFAAENPSLVHYLDDRVAELPAAAPVLGGRDVALTEIAELPFGDAVASPVPPLFEELGLEQGLVRYTTTVPAISDAQPLTVEGLRDRAALKVAGKHAASLERGVAAESVTATGGDQVTLLVESLGRVNYGPLVGETKGITGVRHERQYLHGWHAQPLALDPLPPTTAYAAGDPGPELLARGTLHLDATGDTFLAVPDGDHGYLWVNDFLLGRYDRRGPQVTLYCPQPLLREGANTLTLLELGQAAPSRVELREAPDLG
ncbi:glycoside hydrolase family 35 protein [Kitasatospora griseola]|uniref:glycoside hydrolase family 35 protein n=1 Tax=Kitasatospora griseola TaxID=2064 RepID=UPI00166FCF0E|nr:beta-galactosidase family protein [Kitasatospora griseola]GGQ75815.1 beta-galactosidase [Kitasatospora griseola]